MPHIGGHWWCFYLKVSLVYFIWRDGVHWSAHNYKKVEDDTGTVTNHYFHYPSIIPSINGLFNQSIKCQKTVKKNFYKFTESTVIFKCLVLFCLTKSLKFKDIFNYNHIKHRKQFLKSLNKRISAFLLNTELKWLNWLSKLFRFIFC